MGCIYGKEQHFAKQNIWLFTKKVDVFQNRFQDRNNGVTLTKSAIDISSRLFWCHTNHWQLSLCPIRLDIAHACYTKQQHFHYNHNGRNDDLNHQPHDCLLNHLFKAQIKENTKAPRHWPKVCVCPRTNSQQREKCFHSMTSSCCKTHW